MFIHLLAGLIFAYALIRLILPLPVNGKIKLLAAAALLISVESDLDLQLKNGIIFS